MVPIPARQAVALPPVVGAMARQWAWLAVLLLGSLLAVIGVGLPPADSLWLLAISGAMPVAAIIIGVRQYRPIRRNPWLAIGAGLALFWIGAAPGMAGIWERDALLTQVVTVAGYIGLLVGVVGVLSDRGGDRDASAIFEALILASAAALVAWFALIAPMRETVGAIAFGDSIGALAYPALDLAMFTLVGVTLLRYRRIGATLWLLLPALGTSAATDIGGLLAYASGSSTPAWLGLGGSLLANAFVASAVLHPSFARPLLAQPRPFGRFLRLRIGLVGAATIIAPAMMVFYEVRVHVDGWHVSSLEVALGALLITGLVVADLCLLLTRLDRSLLTRDALEGELKRQAHSDSLTRLPNRAAFVARLDQLLARDRTRLALLFCDLDDFKSVNDTLGHVAGDDLLIQVGERLRQAIRPTDLAARLGGDEFAILLSGVERPADGDIVATRILDAFGPPFGVAGEQLTVGISIGLAFGADVVDASGLMRDADIAMYMAKGRGKRRFERFHPDVRGSAERRTMRTAIEQVTEAV